jgi:hypothetical protein
MGAQAPVQVVIWQGCDWQGEGFTAFVAECVWLYSRTDQVSSIQTARLVCFMDR